MATAAPVERIDIGRVIGRGFSALRANFLAFFACALLLTGAPSFFMQYWALSEAGAVDDLEYFVSLAFWGPVVGALLLTIVTGALLQGVLVRSTILFLSGRQADLSHSLALALRLLIPIIIVSIIVSVLTVLGLLLLIVPGIMIYCAFIVSVPALIEERRGIAGSLRRSRELTRGSRLAIFLLLVIFWVFSVIISGLLGLIGGTPAITPGTVEFPDPILAGATSAIGSALTSVIVAVSLAALYVELRTVKEGATTDDLAAIFE
jgi:hypothetical protein